MATSKHSVFIKASGTLIHVTATCFEFSTRPKMKSNSTACTYEKPTPHDAFCTYLENTKESYQDIWGL
jgi:hypothetical protein